MTDWQFARMVRCLAARSGRMGGPESRDEDIVSQTTRREGSRQRLRRFAAEHIFKAYRVPQRLHSWEDGVYGTTESVSAEVRQRAIWLVMEQRQAHPSEWAALQPVATKLGTTAEMLRKWVRQAERGTGRRPVRTTSERERWRCWSVRIAS